MARGFLVVYKSAEAGAANTIVGDAQDGGNYDKKLFFYIIVCIYNIMR